MTNLDPMHRLKTPLPADEQDLQWLRQAAQGDRDAFSALYRRHQPRLLRFLGRMSQRRDLIDEVINDAMWIAWRKCEGFRGDSKVSTWITGIAYRCMLKALRDRVAREAPEAGAEQPGDADALAEAEQQGAWLQVGDLELRQWVQAGLDRLNEDQRLTVELVYVLGESCEGVAAVMGCAVGTVKARLFHARMRLRNLLPELGEPRALHPSRARDERAAGT